MLNCVHLFASTDAATEKDKPPLKLRERREAPHIFEWIYESPGWVTDLNLSLPAVCWIKKIRIVCAGKQFFCQSFCATPTKLRGVCQKRGAREGIFFNIIQFYLKLCHFSRHHRLSFHSLCDAAALVFFLPQSPKRHRSLCLSCTGCIGNR